ncbi:MAG: hypothetical protein NT007_09885 [Candidatus Kapabacteria bacterium]|nr:hypothetical protein [Candidatus Kapabacteria bacterium]
MTDKEEFCRGIEKEIELFCIESNLGDLVKGRIDDNCNSIYNTNLIESFDKKIEKYY